MAKGSFQPGGQVMGPQLGPGVPEVGQIAGGLISLAVVGGHLEIGGDPDGLPLGCGVEGVLHVDEPQLEAHAGVVGFFQLPLAVVQHGAGAAGGSQIARRRVLPQGEDLAPGIPFVGLAVCKHRIFLCRTPGGGRRAGGSCGKGGNGQGEGQSQQQGQKSLFHGVPPYGS